MLLLTVGISRLQLLRKISKTLGISIALVKGNLGNLQRLSRVSFRFTGINLLNANRIIAANFMAAIT